MSSLRPVWVEVDLSVIRANVRILQRLSRSEAFMAVVKANAYGHGAVPVARAALEAGAGWLGVATLGEALELRQAGLTAPLLILGHTPADQAPVVVAHDLSQAVYDLHTGTAFGRAGRAAGRSARVHLKVDTGMGRLGVLPTAAGVDLARELSAIEGLSLEGVFTHFAAADAADKTVARRQFGLFQGFLRQTEDIGWRWRHCANSAAILDLPETHLDMVRAGISLYGLRPSAETGWPDGLKPALAWKAKLAQVKRVPAGTTVSYGCEFSAPTEGTVLTLPLGYADGYRRGYSGAGVVVKGKRLQVIGRVCMDQTMVWDGEAGPGDYAVGDDAALIGSQGRSTITADDLARHAGTINYEVLTAISGRVPRVYTGEREENAQ